MKRDPKPSAAPRKRCQVNVSLSAKDYAEFVALASADKRKPGALAAILLLDFLKQRRAAPDAPGPEGKQP